MKDEKKIRFSLPLIMAQPWGFAVGLYCALTGMVLTLTQFFTPTAEFTRVQSLPALLNVAWSFGLTIGGIGLVIAVLWHGSGFVGRAIEQSALYLTGSSLMTYAITLAVLTGWKSLLPVALSCVLSLGCFLRHKALQRLEVAVQAISDELAK